MTGADLPRLHPRLWLIAAAVLLVPAIAMQFSREVNWGPGDFAAIALLLGAGCLAWEIAARVVATWRLRVLAGVLIGAAVLLVWAELAVGIFR